MRRTIRVSDLDRLQADIIIILCKLERIFPPAFFSVMVHVAIHLLHEIKVTGPVSYSWMYSIERSLRTLKQYVRNKARPEGTIVEAYVMNESSTFCSRYLSVIETRFIRNERNDDIIVEDEVIGEFEIFKQKVRPLEVDDVENEDLNVLEIVVSHQVDEHIKNDTLCKTDVDPTFVERPIVRHVNDDFINDLDAIFFEFADDLDKLAGGSSSMGDNLSSSSQPSATSTPRRHAESRLLELECYFAENEQIPIMISPGTKKPIFLHIVRFTQRFFVLDFNGQAMNRRAGGSCEVVSTNTRLRRNIRVLGCGGCACNQPLSKDEICEMVLDRRLGYSKGLGWGPKQKAHKTMSASSSTTSCSQSTVEFQLQVKLDQAMQWIEKQT
ncbi:uncharacterized protein E5676_scaffold428G00170 [Cucumis melo var. makuwa]|uniref:DUF4218 domain-containing protein n=1 Tax=Cucumis melo var. makuwa TaxID=1194695 RepID=A0A5A7SNU5_CUCMM|nr:uncharacterized protein E6C27_scaffold708G00170 [Cucumis melo var. makuwa]TYK23940.1 uncharacterized protein E5676_scaffold428G00170 [Cucumis melo var. makuwa]